MDLKVPRPTSQHGDHEAQCWPEPTLRTLVGKESQHLRSTGQSRGKIPVGEAAQVALAVPMLGIVAVPGDQLQRQ